MSQNLAAFYARNFDEAQKKMDESFAKAKESWHNLKIDNLIYKVFRWTWLGQIVILPDKDAFATLESTFAHYSMEVNIAVNLQNSYYELIINEIRFAEGCFPNMNRAKAELAEEAMKKLEDVCFTIIPKNDYRVMTREIVIQYYRLAMADLGRVGHPPFFQTMPEGIGNDPDILLEGVRKVLNLYSNNRDLKSLSFEGFNQVEMQEIALAAAALQVSVEVMPDKVVVTNKINRVEIIRRVLRSKGEEGGYYVHIPHRHHHLWFNDKEFQFEMN